MYSLLLVPLWALSAPAPVPLTPPEPTGAPMADWYAAPVPVDRPASGPAAMAHLLHRPAGKHGFVTTSGDQFVFEDGTPARFWGTNLTFGACLPPPELADGLAARLASLGYNLVRFHHMDNRPPPEGIIDYARGDSRHLSEAMLQRLDHLLAALPKHGIYYNLNLQVSRRYRKADGLPADLESKQKFASVYFERLIELQEEYATALLTRKNSVTGVRYADDPALALVELTNETSLFGGVGTGAFDGRGIHAPPPPYQKEFERQWSQWLRQRYGSQTALRKAWGAKGLMPEEDLKRGTVYAPSQKVMRKAPPRRRTDAIRFLVETQTRTHRRLRNHVRSLGVRIPITSTHHYDLLPSLAARSEMDFLDTHGYWNPPKGRGRKRSIDPSASLLGNPSARKQGVAESGVISPIPRWALCSVQGKPMTVSEWNQCWPAPDSYELPLVAASYAAFQGWDGMMSFAFAQNLDRATRPGPLDGPFAVSRSAVHAALNPVCALLYLRGDVSMAPEAFSVPYDPDQLYADAGRLSMGESRYWWGHDLPWELPLVRRVERSFEGPASRRRFELPNPHHLATDTGELQWFPAAGSERGHVRIATPCASVLVGALAHRTLEAGALRTEAEHDAAIAAISLDGAPLEQSAEILVAVVGNERNTGQELSRDGQLTQMGIAPVLLETIRGHISLSRAAGAPPLEASALDLNGREVAQIPLESSPEGEGTTIRMPIGTVPAPHFVLRARRPTPPQSM